MMVTNKTPIQVFVELIFKNLFWYLVFSLIYFDTNPLNWWIFENIWGRVIVAFLEFSIINSIFKEEKNGKS